MLVLVLCFTACEDELVGAGGETTIRVRADIKYSGAESRAVLSDAEEKNVSGKYVFMLYKGSDRSATLEALKEFDNGSGTVDGVKISVDAEYTAIMIANTSIAELNVSVGSTLEALYSATYAVNTTDNNPSSSGFKFTWSQAMTGLTYEKIAAGLNFTGEKALNPNVAKVTVNITNNSSSVESTQLVNVQVRNVVNKVRFAQNALSKAMPVLFTSDDNKSGDISYIDYEIEQLDIVPGGASSSFSWYVPHNECGTGKRPQAGVAGVLPANQTPTYVEIDGVRCIDFLDTGYKVYPGIKAGNEEYVNMTNFDVKADYQYTINADITNNGLTFNVVNNSDQVNGTEGQLVKLPSNANCYMIHPIGSMIKTGTSTVYELPIDRINEYWGATGGLAPDGDMDIEDNDTWTMEVIWQDINHQAIKFCQRDGSALTDTYTGKGLTPAYFKLMNTNTDAENQWYGNILVGVKKSGQSTYLWSWHLWITDYNPDAAYPYEEAMKIVSLGRNALYDQGGGDGNAPSDLDRQGFATANSAKKYYSNVQHYHHEFDFYWGANYISDEIWDNGIYANSWIMDRNLGAQSPSPMHETDPLTAYGMYYQWGRKDPFPHAIYYKNSTADNVTAGTNPLKQLYKIDGEEKISYIFADTQSDKTTQRTIKEATQNPNTFYALEGAGWCKDGTNNLWSHPKSINRGDKSIFDPCPPGWCVPVYDAFDFLTYSGDDSSLNSGLYSSTNSSTWTTLKSTFNIYRIRSTSTTDEEGTDNPRNTAMAICFRDGVVTAGARKDLFATFPMQGVLTEHDNGISDNRKCYMWFAESSKITTGQGDAVAMITTASGNTYRGNKTTTVPQTAAFESRTSQGDYYYVVFNGRLSHTPFVKSRGHNVRCIQTPNKETLKFYNKK